MLPSLGHIFTPLLFLDPPTSLNVGASINQRKRRTLVAPDMNVSLDQSEGSMLSDDCLETPDDLDINVDDIETPDETDSLEFMNNGNELEWEGQKPSLGNCRRNTHSVILTMLFK